MRFCRVHKQVQRKDELKLKRFICAVTAFFCILCLFPRTSLAQFDPESVSTPYIVLMDAATGNVLYERNATERAYPASTTKIMTCILALEMCQSQDEIVKAGDPVESRGSVAGITRGEEMPLIDMLYGVMLRSGNDTARAVAEHFGNGEESAFVELMNQKAASLGMTKTHFVKSNGLHKDDHYSTAYDMAILTRYAMQNPDFRKIVSTVSYHAEPTNKDSDGYDWNNSNRLLYTPEDKTDITYPYATGVKTGDTAQAGRCLVASAEKDGITLLLVLFGDMENKVPTEYRFENAAKFFDWGFENYAVLDASMLDIETTMALPVAGASPDDPEKGNLTLNIDLDGVRISGLKSEIAEIQADPSGISSTYVLESTLQAPIKAGSTVGTIYYKYNGLSLFSASLIASRDVLAPESIEVSSPNASPIIVQGRNGDDKESDSSHAWLFWALLCFVLLVVIVVLRLLSMRSSRRGVSRRRRSNYRIYRR